MAAELSAALRLPGERLPRDGDRLPFLVYGTLRTGFRNHNNVVRGRHTHAVPGARLQGLRLFHFPRLGYPGCYRGDSSSVLVGELLYFPPESFAEVCADLDRLEDYHGPGHPWNLYERVVVHVRVPRVEPPGVTAVGASSGAGAMPEPPAHAASAAAAGGSAGAADVADTVELEAFVYICLTDPAAVGGVVVPHGDWAAHLRATGEADAGDDWAAATAAVLAAEAEEAALKSAGAPRAATAVAAAAVAAAAAGSRAGVRVEEEES